MFLYSKIKMKKQIYVLIGLIVVWAFFLWNEEKWLPVNDNSFETQACYDCEDNIYWPTGQKWECRINSGEFYKKSECEKSWYVCESKQAIWWEWICRKRKNGCWNWVVEPWEECDHGNENGVEPDGGGAYCDQNCKQSLILVLDSPEPWCGDWFVQPELWEQCDDWSNNWKPDTVAELQAWGGVMNPRYIFCSESCQIIEKYSCPWWWQSCQTNNDCTFDPDPVGWTNYDDLYTSNSTTCDDDNMCTCIEWRELRWEYESDVRKDSSCREWDRCNTNDDCGDWYCADLQYEKECVC